MPCLSLPACFLVNPTIVLGLIAPVSGGLSIIGVSADDGPKMKASYLDRVTCESETFI